MRVIINSSEADRLAVAAVLLKNKYTVRLGQEVPQGKRKPVYFVEYMVEYTEPEKEATQDVYGGGVGGAGGV